MWTYYIYIISTVYITFLLIFKSKFFEFIAAYAISFDYRCSFSFKSRYIYVKSLVFILFDCWCIFIWMNSWRAITPVAQRVCTETLDGVALIFEQRYVNHHQLDEYIDLLCFDVEKSKYFLIKCSCIWIYFHIIFTRSININSYINIY